MRAWYWCQSFMVGGVPTVLKLGNASEFAGTATLGAGTYWLAILVIESSRLAGITLPGNGSPEEGSITSTHLRAAGLAWHSAELRGRSPVPALSSARLPSSCARDGYVPVAAELTRCRKPS